MRMFNCPHCEAVESYDTAWESLDQEQDCETCGQTYVLIDSRGGPNALEAVKLPGAA